MICFKCDGYNYEKEKQCISEYEADDLNDYPDHWLVIRGSIKSGLPNARLLENNDAILHFCSSKCLNDYLFIDFKSV